MAHFAELDENNIVQRVLFIDDQYESDGDNYLANVLGLGGRWIQTSYNNKMRGKFAGLGDTYNPESDIFIAAPSPVRQQEDDLATE